MPVRVPRVGALFEKDRLSVFFSVSEQLTFVQVLHQCLYLWCWVFECLMLAELGAFTLLREYECSDFISCVPAVVGARSALTESVQSRSLPCLTRLTPSLLSSSASEQGKMWRPRRPTSFSSGELSYFSVVVLQQAALPLVAASLHPLNLPCS